MALNIRGCEYCGVRSERDAIGKTDRDFFPRSRASKYIADDRSVMKSGLPIVNRIEPAPEHEGSPRLVITNKIPLRDPQGTVVGIMGFSRHLDQVRYAPSMLKSLASAIDYLHQHFAQPLSTEDLASQAGLSVSQFERTFRKAFGTSPRQYVVRVRIENACQQLSATENSISQIAQQCGFYDHAHFTRAFRTLMGESPSQYRKSQQNLEMRLAEVDR